MSAHETAEAILLVIKRIAKWLFFGALIVTGFIASLYGGKILQEEYENRPRLVTSIGNVTLGDKLTDVLFREPDFIREVDYQKLNKSSGAIGERSPPASGPATNTRRTIVFFINVRLPDGTLIRGVPEGTTRAQLAEKLRNNGFDVSGLEGQAYIFEAVSDSMPPESEATLSTITGQQILEQKRAIAVAAARKAKAEAELRGLEGGAYPARAAGEGENWQTIFRSNATSRLIEIEGGHVKRIGYSCREGSDYKSVGGVQCGASGEAVFDRFKNAVKVQCLRDKSDPDYVRHRVYDVEKFGTRYHLMSNHVVVFDVMAPSVLAAATGVTWGSCE